MPDDKVRFPAEIITDKDRQSREIDIARESQITIVVNGDELVSMLCSPSDIKELAVGFLWTEGFINNKDEIKKMVVYDRGGIVRIETTNKLDPALLEKRTITSGCGRGTTFYGSIMKSGGYLENKYQISADKIFALVDIFQHYSTLYSETHGVHSSALCDDTSILIHMEDVGRHNAVDKIIGRCILEDIDFSNHILLTSGRISSEIMKKTARAGIPIIITVSMPTDMAVNAARDIGITLICAVRVNKKMTVLTHGWRITT